MKKYLLLTTAFLSVANISYASDDREEVGPSSSQPRATPQEEINAILKKYAPDNLVRGAFNDLKSKDVAVVQGRQYKIPLTGNLNNDQELTKSFRAILPVSLPSNAMRTLSVADTTHDLELMKVYVTYQYFSAWGLGNSTEYQFKVETFLDAPDYKRLLALQKNEYDSSSSSSSSSSPRLSPSASSESLSIDTGYESDEETQKLKAVIAKLTEENARLLQSSSSASAAAAPSDEFAPPPPPSAPPAPPAPGSGTISRSRTQKVVILSPEYQPTYNDLDAEVKQVVSTWQQARIELYLKVLTEKGNEHANIFLSLDETQAQKVLKMPTYGQQIGYLSLTPEVRKQKDDEDAAKAQRNTEAAAKQGDMLQELLSKRAPVAFYEPSIKEEKSNTIDSSTLSFAQVLQLTVSDQEQQAFEAAKKIWSSISDTRKEQLLARFPNDIVLKGILLKTINGEIVTLDSNKRSQYTPPTILKAGISLLAQQKETPQDLRFTAEGIRDLSVYALLNAKAIGINPTQIRPIIEELRKQTF